MFAAGDPPGTLSRKRSAVAAYPFGRDEHCCPPLRFHDPVELVPILVSATRSDKDVPEQPRKLCSAEVLGPVLGSYEPGWTFHRDPVSAVPEHGRRPATAAQVLKLARGSTRDQADASIPGDRVVDDPSGDYRCMDGPVGPDRGDNGQRVLSGKSPDVI